MVAALAQETLPSVSKTQRFSLKHRVDLLEVCAAEDIKEMQAMLLSTLKHLTGAQPIICTHPQHGELIAVANWPSVFFRRSTLYDIWLLDSGVSGNMFYGGLRYHVHAG